MSSSHDKPARRAAREAADKWPKIHQLIESLRQLRRENHFAELIEQAWGKR